MPITQFFLMLDESLILRANHYSELCDIQAISVTTTKYYEELKEKYLNIVYNKTPEIPEAPPLPARESFNPVLPAESEAARANVLHLMGLMKGTV